MDLNNDHLHHYVAEYTEGTMSADLVPIFEQFLWMNPEIAKFVEKAKKGHQWILRHRKLLVRQ